MSARNVSIKNQDWKACLATFSFQLGEDAQVIEIGEQKLPKPI